MELLVSTVIPAGSLIVSAISTALLVYSWKKARKQDWESWRRAMAWDSLNKLLDNIEMISQLAHEFYSNEPCYYEKDQGKIMYSTAQKLRHDMSRIGQMLEIYQELLGLDRSFSTNQYANFKEKITEFLLDMRHDSTPTRQEKIKEHIELSRKELSQHLRSSFLNMMKIE